ncbi:hypothetical protein IAT38_001421 [Cryptococcus sp. DSM 104549]
MVEVRSSPGVAVRNPAQSAQSLVVVLFLVLLIYIFFSGGKKGKGSGSDGSSSPSRTSSRRRGGGGGTESGSSAGETPQRKSRRDKSNRGGNEEKRSKGKDRKSRSKGTDSGTSGDSSDGGRKRSKGDGGDKESNRSKDKKKRDKKKKGKKEKKEPEWAQPDTPPPISPIPDHRTATPKKSIFRKRGSDNSLPPSPNTSARNGIKWNDQQGHSPHEVTNHFQKWGEYVGITDRSDDAWDPMKRKPDKPIWKRHKKVLLDPATWASDTLAKEGKLDADLVKAMAKAEEISKAKPRDPHWATALQDDWDDTLGPIPAVAMDMAKKISRFIKREDLKLLGQAMKERKNKKAKQDKSRQTLEDLLSALDIPRDHPDIVLKVVLGWYCDTYRCTHFSDRVAIADEPVPMLSHPELGPTARMLVWMEYLGKLNMAQRLFVGLDLTGLAMRVQAMKEGEGYRLDLTVFLPGGPQKKYKEASADWYMRLEVSAQAFRTIHLEIARLFDKTDSDMIERDPFTRRRLIFRPGWTVLGVDSKKMGKPTPEKSVAQRTMLRRPPKVFELRPDIENEVPKVWRKPTKQVKKAISRLCPGEVCYQSIRQYAWDNNSVTKENSTFSHITFWVAWQFIGEGLQYNVLEGMTMKNQAYDFVRSLDLGGYTPIHLTDPPTFLRLDGFPALEVLVVSYIPLGEKGGTAELILNKNFGLLENLIKQREATRHLSGPPPKLKLFISVANGSVVPKLQADIDRRLAVEGREYAASGSSKEEAAVMMSELAQAALEGVFLVDESAAGQAGEGKLPRGVKMEYDPRGAERLLGYGRGGAAPPTQPRPPPRGPPPTPPPPTGNGLPVGATPLDGNFQPPPSPSESSTASSPFTPPRPPPPPPPQFRPMPEPMGQRGRPPPPVQPVDLPLPGGGMAPPLPATRKPAFTTPSAAAAAERAAQQRAMEMQAEGALSPETAARGARNDQRRAGMRQSNYRPPSVEDAPEEDEPMPTSFRGLNGIDSNFNGGGGGR